MINAKLISRIILGMALVFTASGCGVNFYFGRPTDLKRIEELSAQMDRLKNQKMAEIDQLQETQEALRQRLQKELQDKQVKLEMAEKGLVVTFVGDVLFDSGKATIRPEAQETLTKIASVIREKVSDRSIGVEGHTDNEPIKLSGWKSNWELSTGRATSVLHFLENQGVNPRRLVAAGYGEYQPVADNDSAEGRRQNRRVEIVILPKQFTKAERDLIRQAERSPDPEVAKKAKALLEYK